MVTCDPHSAFFGLMGVVCAMVFSNLGAAYGTARSGVGISSMGVMRPDLVMRSIVPVIMAGVLGIYGLIISIVITSSLGNPASYSAFAGYSHLAAGLVVGLSCLAAGLAIGIVGDAGVRANAQQTRLFVGMILTLVFAETLALYGLIIGLVVTMKTPSGLCTPYALKLVQCVHNTSGNIGNIIGPMAMNGLSSAIFGTTPLQSQTPHIALKIMPSKRIRLTPSEMNTLLFDIKQEIKRKVNKLEGKWPIEERGGIDFSLQGSGHTKELYEHRADNERHMSAWVLNKAPVYMPFHDANKGKIPKYNKTLSMAMKRLENKFEPKESKEEKEHKSTDAPKVENSNNN